MHWHAFVYNGAETPSDSAANDLSQPVRPVDLRDWFEKPASMRRGTYTDVDGAHAWLATELAEVDPRPDLLPDSLEHYRTHLELGQDAYAGGYARDHRGVYVRCLLTCPRTGADVRPVQCPVAP